MEIEKKEIEKEEIQPEEKKPEAPASPDDIAAELAEKMAKPSEHVIENEMAQVQEQETERATGGMVSPSGEVFDSDIHVSPDKINADGSFRKRPGRKKQTQSTTPKSESQLGNIHADNTPPPPSGSQVAGKAAAHAMFMMGVAIGGEEWQPVVNPEVGINEPEMLTGAFADYFEAKGVEDFPPGVALTMAVLSYAAPRFQQPKTKTRFGLLKAWLKNKFVRNKKIDGLKTKEEKGGE